MQLNNKTLEKLRIIINGDGIGDYRSGPKLVAFFNELGFNDSYGQGFPSRWIFTDEKLKKINGTPELDKCLRNTFAVVNYIGRVPELDALISEFNKYMVFDKWEIVRNNDAITFRKIDKVIVDENKVGASKLQEDEFLKQSFSVDVYSLGLDANISEIIKLRLVEVEACLSKEASLASVILIGSVLEGILLGIALTYPRQYNLSSSAPRDKNSGNVYQFHKWTLNNLIDVSSEIGALKEDVKMFSQVVRHFRNYIHPYEQMSSRFIPDKHTALICWQVLKAAISQIGDYRKKEGRQTYGQAENENPKPIR